MQCFGPCASITTASPPLQKEKRMFSQNKTTSKWSFQEIMLLINEVDKRKHIVIGPRRDKSLTIDIRREAWQEISDELAKANFPPRSYVHCESKWNTMKKAALRRKQFYTNRKKKQKLENKGQTLEPFQSSGDFEEYYSDTDNDQTNGAVGNLSQISDSLAKHNMQMDNNKLLKQLVQGQKKLSEELSKVYSAQVEILACLKPKD